MDLSDEQMRVSVRELLTAAGFSPGQATQMIDGLDTMEELSKEAGELSDKTVRELNLVTTPFVGMLSLSMASDDASNAGYFSLLKSLLGEVMRATYQIGVKNSVSIWQDQEDNKDLPN